MNKTKFIRVRRIVRRRGWRGVRWLHIIFSKTTSGQYFVYQLKVLSAVDVLHERQKMVDNCKKLGISYDIKMLRSCDHKMIYK